MGCSVEFFISSRCPEELLEECSYPSEKALDGHDVGLARRFGVACSATLGRAGLSTGLLVRNLIQVTMIQKPY